MTTRGASRADTRARVVQAAARLLRQDGPAAVTTRAVAERAGVQPPAIYRIFGDKDGLLEAVAEHVMASYVAAKAEVVKAAAADDVDPVEELRSGWGAQIDFALANPSIFRLLSDPDRTTRSPAALSGRRVLETRINRVAAVGRLRVEENRAVEMVQAAGIGAIQTLLSVAPDKRDAGLATAMLDAVLARILTDSPDAANDGPVRNAVALRAVVPELEVFTDSEKALLADWLARIVVPVD